jgi:large subunit ribosomal protein L23
MSRIKETQGGRHQGKGLILQPHQVILRPLVSEKSLWLAKRWNQYAFEVHPLATKQDVKEAVEQIFEVRVLKVRTLHRLGKKVRTRLIRGQRRSWKKALVTLHPDDRINVL